MLLQNLIMKSIYDSCENDTEEAPFNFPKRPFHFNLRAVIKNLAEVTWSVLRLSNDAFHVCTGYGQMRPVGPVGPRLTCFDTKLRPPNQTTRFKMAIAIILIHYTFTANTQPV